MNITLAIDTRSLSRPKTGVGAYTDGLVKELKRRETFKIRELNFGAVRGHITPSRVVRLLNRYRLIPPIDWFTRGDVFLFPDFVSLPTASAPSMVVIHDLAYRHFPESLDAKNRIFLSTHVPRTLDRVDHVIAVSEATKRDIMNTYGTAGEKISVVYPGVDLSEYSPKSEQHDQGPLRRYGIKPGAVLFLGTLEPRKCVRTLIDAYSALPKELQDKHQLVIAGGDGWGGEAERLRNRAKPLNAVFTGRVADHEIASLYRNATVTVLPSKFEGFGMTMIESMACGTPVIGADNSSISEVVADSGLLFETNNSGDLAQKLEQVLTDKRLQNELSKKGLTRAQDFTWEKSVDALEKVIKKVAS